MIKKDKEGALRVERYLRREWAEAAESHGRWLEDGLVVNTEAEMIWLKARRVLISPK